MKGIYADYNATTPVITAVKDYLLKGRLDGPFANPNSLHYQGVRILGGIEKCRELIAKKINVNPAKIVFNSGSSESISHTFWATIGQEILKKSKRLHILCSTLEHAAVIESATYWSNHGAEIHWIPSNAQGIVDLSILEKKINELSTEIALVAVMAANNETGVIQPYGEIAKLCKKNQLNYLCDTTQVIGKLPLDAELNDGVFFCASSHKLGAPLGSGFLVTAYQDFYQPLIFGGSQEKGKRGGTQNYLGIECMTMALDWHFKNLSQWEKIQSEKEAFEKLLTKLIPDCHILCDSVLRLPNTTLASFTGIHSQGLQIELESKNIFVTTSAACSDNEPSTSRVLKSMGINDDEGRSVIRISTGLEFKLEDYAKIAEALKISFEDLSKIKF